MEAMERDLLRAMRTIKSLSAAICTKIDRCDQDNLAQVRGVIESQLDNLQLWQGKTPEVVR